MQSTNKPKASQGWARASEMNQDAADEGEGDSGSDSEGDSEDDSRGQGYVYRVFISVVFFGMLCPGEYVRNDYFNQSS